VTDHNQPARADSLSGGFSVRIEPGHESYSCLPSESLLQGMTRLGRRVIPMGCVNGGCGVCKVEVLSGDYETGLMSRAHVTEDEQGCGIALACKVFPRSDLTLRVLGKLSKFIHSKP
jgi:ferredoxin